MQVLLSLLLASIFPQKLHSGKVNLAWEQCSKLGISHTFDTQAVITGLFAVRRRSKEDVDPSAICGSISDQGVQNVEAVRWVLGLLNQDYGDVFGQRISGSFVPGIRIGIDATDTCGNRDLAIQQALDSFSDLHNPAGYCAFNQTQINLGVLGLDSDAGAKEVSTFLEKFQHPTISHGAISSDIGDTTNFFRTSPNLSVLAEAMVATAVQFSWDSVAVVYSDCGYGKEGKRLLIYWAKKYKLCISNVETIPSNHTSSNQEFSRVLSRLNQNLPASPAVLVFASKTPSLKLLEVYGGKQTRLSLLQQQNQLKWIFSETISEHIQEVAEFPASAIRGLFSVASSAPTRIPEFDQYWSSIDPRQGNYSYWLREIFQIWSKCRLPNDVNTELAHLPVCSSDLEISMPPPADNPNLVSLLDGVYGYALALKEAWKLKCKNRPGLCPQLVQMKNQEFLDILRAVEFEYGSNVRSPPSLRSRKVSFKHPPKAASVFELQEDATGLKFTEVFKFESGNKPVSVSKPIFYSVNVAGQTVQSAAPPVSGCLVPDCYCLESIEDSGFRYIPGDLHLAAILPIHSSGKSPYFCGKIEKNNSGYQLAEAFWYAMANVNGESGKFRNILPGVTIGSLTVDSCGQSARAAHVLGGLLTGELLDDTLTIADLIGVVGGGVQPFTFGPVFGVTQISYESGSDWNTLQTVVSDDTRLNLVFEILQEFGWDFVQIVYSESKYGNRMREKFMLTAPDRGICWAQEHRISADGDFQKIVDDMNENSLAQVIIILAETSEVRALLTALNNATTAKFTFIVPKFWGPQSDLTEFPVEALAFDTSLAQNAEFNQHLIRQSASKGNENSWTRDFVESNFDCNFLEGAKNGSKQGICDQKTVFGQIPNFRPDPRANDVINSVYAFVFGLNEALKKFCGDAFDGICSSFRALDPNTRNNAIFEAVKNVKFRDESNRNFGFTAERDGAIPLTIYDYRTLPGAKNPTYTQVGSYPAVRSGDLVNPGTVRHYSGTVSTCINPRICPQCAVDLFVSQNISFANEIPLTTSTRVPSTTTETSKHFRMAQNDLDDLEILQKPFLYQPSEEKVVLGALLPIHTKGPSPFECGKVDESGILMLESFLWALDTMNQNSQVLKGIDLGAFVTDTCSSSGEMFANLKNLFTKPGFFSNQNSSLRSDWIFGFLNPPENELAITAAEVFRQYKVTNIGPDSPTEIFNHREKFPYTLRTSVPSDIQIKGLVQVLKRMNFTYISVIHSLSRHGSAEFRSFQSETLREGICLALSASFPPSDGPNSKMFLDQVVLRLKTKKMQGARAVVLLLSDNETNGFLQAVSRAEKHGLVNPGDFSFFSSVGWGDSTKAIRGVEETGLGSITLQYNIEILEPFKEFLRSLRFENNPRNPWWTNYWMEKFGCNSTEECGNYKLNLEELYLSPVLSNVVNGVWSMAVGLANLQQDFCGMKEPGFCESLRSRADLRDLIFKNVREAAFSRADRPEKTFHFNSAGYSDMGLSVLNLVREAGQQGAISYRKVGQIYGDNLTMSLVPMAFKNSNPVQMRDLKSECSNLSICFECKTMASIAEKNQKLSVTPTTTFPSSTATSSTKTTVPNIETSTIFAIANHLTTTPLPKLPEYEGNFIFKQPSDSGFLISAVLPLHTKGGAPFSCGKMKTEYYQNLEGIQWAINQVNQDPTLLPGIQLGVMILDSCSQPSKAVRDLSNFFSNQIQFPSGNGSSIDPNNTVGLVASLDNEEALAISRVASQFGIATVSPGAEAELRDAGFRNHLVRTSVSNRNQAEALVSVLQRMKWDSVAFLYTNDVGGVSGKEDFESIAKEKGICLALSDSLPYASCEDDLISYDRTVARLISLRQVGVYGVVLWVTPRDLKCVMGSVKRAIRAGSLKRGDLIWIVPVLTENLQDLLEGEEADSIGMICLQPQADSVAAFERHWKELSVETAEDRWKMEFFENTFGCRGMNCVSNKYSMASRTYKENPYLLNTVNSVLSIAHAIENIRRTLCGAQTIGICEKMKKHPKLRQVIAEAIKSVKFQDFSGKFFQFTAEGFSNTALEIINLQRNINGFEYRLVGSYSSSDGLLMKIPLKGFENGLQSFYLRDRVSTCMDFAVCPICQKYQETSVSDSLPHRIPESTTQLSTSSIRDMQYTISNWIGHRQPDPSDIYKKSLEPAKMNVGSRRILKDSVIVPSNKRFSLAGIFELHKSADPLGLSCGDFNPSSGFQKLAAFFFALNEVNNDPHILPGIELGAVAIDSCSSEERAMANLFEIFAGSNSTITTSDIVALVGLDGESAVSMKSMLKTMDLSVVESTPAPLALRSEETVMGTVPASNVHVQILADILHQMDWSYISVMYEESVAFQPSAEFLRSLVYSRGICVAKMMNISSDGSLEEMQIAVRRLVMKTGSRAVILFLSDRNIRMLLRALAVERVAPARFIFVTTFNEDWTFDMEFLSLLSRFQQGLLTLEIQRYNNTNFLQYLNSLTPQNHQPFPDSWFYEYWEHTFQCYIPEAERSGMFSNPCSGSEKINASGFQQSPTILPTVLAVQSAARGLQRFLQENCPGRPVGSLSECLVSNPKTHVLRAMKNLNFSYAYSSGKEPVWVNFDSYGFMDMEYSIRNMLRRPDGNYQYQEVGVWRPGVGLLLDTNQIKVLGSQGDVDIPKSKCPGEICSECPNVTSFLEAVAKPELAERFDSVWAVIVASLAGLGMIVCLICILYFSITFPSNYGTTVCGYVLIFGIFLVYAMSFAFVFNPSAVTCTIRRIGTGICWAFVFAPMLVKVVHSWHMRSMEPKLMGANAHQTSPFSLFCLCIGVAGVQIVIAIEWVILDTPNYLVYLYEYGGDVLVPGMWRCTPGGDFEKLLTVSMVYVMFLIFLCTVFSLMTWNTDVHNRESRWVFVACVFTTGIWIAWWCLATQTTYALRDPAAAIVCVTNATIILMCLYMRKAYLYQKYREEAKDFIDPSTCYQSSTVNSHFMLNGHLYGGKMMVGSGQSVFVHALPALPGPPVGVPPSEVGSVVYQNAAYDGGSEFNPGGSTLGGVQPSASAGLVIVDGQGAENGGIEESHRF